MDMQVLYEEREREKKHGTKGEAISIKREGEKSMSETGDWQKAEV